MVNEELKKVFAAEWATTPDQPYPAALRATNGIVGDALWIFDFWVKDVDVIAMRDEYIETNKAPLPTKSENAEAVWNLANNPNVAPKDRIAAFELYAKICGHIERPLALPTGKGINEAVKTHKFVIRDFGSDEDWEKKLEQQQRAALNAE